MKVIKGIPPTFSYPNPVVTIGNFDGVHIGHQKIFRKAVEKAREIGGTPVVVTFCPHPVRVLSPERGLKLITTFDEKTAIIAHAGIKVLVCVPFDLQFAHMEPEAFIKKVLIDTVKAQWVIVGHNFAFGKGKKGTTALLRRRGKKYGFGVTVVRYAKACGEIVSSSKVRMNVQWGHVGTAAKMLGRAYHIEGEVVRGAGRGTPLLHTPTANLKTENELIPKEGVYAVRAVILDSAPPHHCITESSLYDGVANIGRNPTFGESKITYEVHLFNFHQDIVGKRMRVFFIEKIRDEKSFPTAEKLKIAIAYDIAQAKEMLSKSSTPLQP